MDATNYLSTIVVLFLTLCLFIQKGLAISCFTCNTYHHYGDCENLPEEKQYLYKVNCDFLSGNRTYTKCRKMVQTYGDEVRVIRQCATEGHEDCRLRSGTYRVKVEYCQCTGDFCNAVGKAEVSLPLLMTIMIPTWRLLW